MQDERGGREVTQLLLCRLDEQRLGEEGVIRQVSHGPHGDAMSGVGAGERIDDVDLVTLLEMRDDLLAQAVELILGERPVDVAPPDPALRGGLADEELVLRRAPRVNARVE